MSQSPSKTTTIVIPPAVDALIKNLALEFAIPIVREDTIHPSIGLTLAEIEPFFNHVSAYVRKLKRVISDHSNERLEETQLATRARQLEGDLRYALMAAEDVKALRAKASHLVECVRLEKDKVVAEGVKVEKYAQHVAILEDHIEKV
jgi:hypothetical protein